MQEHEINLDVLILTAREKHGLVLTREMAQNAIAQGAPITPEGEFDPLDLAAWLIAAAMGKTP